MSRKVARILVVDDEPALRELLADALAADEVHVTTAGSGTEAIDLGTDQKPDLIVADLYLGDCNGLEVIDALRRRGGEIPAVVITGRGDAASLSEASRCRPVEMMNKPLDLDRLRTTVREALHRKDLTDRQCRRTRRLRKLARATNIERKTIRYKLHTTCAELTSAYRSLSGQMASQEVMISHQQQLIAARNDDDVFRAMFRVFVRRSGPVFGVALACDTAAELQIVGRFGVPRPDGPRFCEALSRPVIQQLLLDPRCTRIDAGEQSELFDESIRKHLVGLNILGVPLLPSSGEMIGLVVLYRKGEQPFDEPDLALAKLVAHPTALAVQRTD